MISKEAFLSARFEHERWFDSFPYAIGDDQMLAYKLYLSGKKVIVHYESGVEHRDARTAHVDSMQTRDYNDMVIRYIIWYRTVYQCRKTASGKVSAVVAFYFFWFWHFLLDVLSWGRRRCMYKPESAISSLCEAKNFVESETFRSLPVWEKKSNMATAPILFTFGSSLFTPAVVSMTSLLENAFPDTFCDIYIPHNAWTSFSGPFWRKCQGGFGTVS